MVEVLITPQKIRNLSHNYATAQVGVAPLPGAVNYAICEMGNSDIIQIRSISDGSLLMNLNSYDMRGLSTKENDDKLYFKDYYSASFGTWDFSANTYGTMTAGGGASSSQYMHKVDPVNNDSWQMRVSPSTSTATIYKYIDNAGTGTSMTLGASMSGGFAISEEFIFRLNGATLYAFNKSTGATVTTYTLADTYVNGYSDYWVDTQTGTLMFPISTSQLAVYQIFSVNAPPTITVTPVDEARVDPRNATNISWTYSDAEGDPQTAFDVKVREQPVVAQSWTSGPTAKTGTIQVFTVPSTGRYTIEAIGAAGGKSSDGFDGGKGARVVGDFDLTAGTQLNVIAGKPGQQPTESTRGGGGGGASWVYKTGDAEPLVVAGGGGGAGNYAYAPTYQDASVTTNGRAGLVNGNTSPGGSGGTGGSGGSGYQYASGGGGWRGNGGNGSSTTGGSSPSNGATGGNAYNTSNGAGGFGGGGGAYAGAAGGGGYSGGGAGGWSNSSAGGGGGSYNGGVNQIMEEGIGTNEGSVTIYQEGTAVFSTSGTTATSVVMPANSMVDQQEYNLVVKVDNAVSSTTVRQSLFADTWNYPAAVVTSNQFGNFDLSQLSHGDTLEIQVATSDEEEFGPYSEVIQFINNNFPSLSMPSDPIVFTDTESVVRWTYVDADGDSQTAYQIRVRKKI